MGRAACAALLAGTLAMPATAFAAAGFPDSDVAPDAWYVGHIQEAVDAGIVRGYPDGMFRPEEGVTRAQVAEMLCRAEGAALPEGEVDAENKTPWADVEGGMWYTHAMNWAYENGVFTGDGDGDTTARPDDGILREEMAKVVASYMKTFRGADIAADGLAWPEGTTGESELSFWAEPFFLWLANQGVMGGHVFEDGTSYLDAKGATTRAQFAKLAVKASTWTEGSVPGGPGAGVEQAIAKAEACDVVQNGATIRVFDAKGADITALCEFAIGSQWQSSPKIDGLAANTEYTVHIRLARVGDKPAGPVFDLKFRTAAEQGGGETPDVQIEIAELRVDRVSATWVAVGAYKADGGAIPTGACEFRIAPDGAWQTDGNFSGLLPDTAYTLEARVKAADGRPAGPVKTLRFRTEQGEAAQKAEAPAGIRFFGVGQTSFGVRPVNAEGDLLDGRKYEYRLDGGAWMRGTDQGCNFAGLKPGTEYSVSVRTAAGGGLAASDAVTETVRTQAEQGEKPSPQAVWVAEYTPIMTVADEIVGTGSVNGVYDKWQQDCVTGVKTSLQTQDMKAVDKLRVEYFASMEDLAAPFSDDWDSVAKQSSTTSYVFVKTGGHWETPKNEEERKKLYSYNTSQARQFPVTVSSRDVEYFFICADGKEYASKKAAFNSGSKIVSLRYGNTDFAKKKTYDFEKLIREAGGTPGEAWCHTGETLATMDGNSSNQ